LDGLGVLVTRPTGQAEGLCRLIEDAGGEAVRLPLLEIVPAEPDGEGARRLRSLHHVDWLIFVSANAVRYAFALMGAHHEGEQWPRIGAIGRATAEELAKQGVAVDLMPKEQFNSETLLAAPEFADVKGLHFLIVRGEGGRETLAETLRACGAQVDYAEVYRRTLPPIDVAGVIRRWRDGGIRVITITSGDALANLARLVEEEAMELLTRTPVVVISERLAQQARDLGCARVETATAASDEAMVESVIRLALSS
jgi:uroporphyrinogen-III synthase